MMTRLIALMRSFRVRIALLSTLLSGLVLAAFAMGAWGVVHEASLRRLDEDIREIGVRRLSIPQGPMHWREFADSLAFVMGDEEEEPFILLVTNRNGDLLHRSKSWPDWLPLGALPFSTDGPPVADSMGSPAGEKPSPGAAPWDQPTRRERRINPLRSPRPGHPPPRRMPVTTRRPFIVEVHGRQYRAIMMCNPQVTLVLGLSMSNYASDMRLLRGVLLITLPVGLILIAGGAWFVSQRALRPIHALTEAAERVSARDLSQRIPLRNDGTEFNRLIHVFNGMMDRLEKSFRQAVRFSADAAHEIKTPLTILQGELEEALSAAPAGSPQQQVYNTLHEEVQRLKTITRKLLLLSLADSGQLRISLQLLNLSETLDSVRDDIEILAPRLTLEARITPDLWVMADEDLMEQLLQNLANNAIKYNKPEGWISLELDGQGDKVIFRISNAGAGIPDGEQDRVFERFYRADPARNRSVDGHGLGLSLARELARAHGGELRLEYTSTESTVFALVLPMAPKQGTAP